MLIESVSDPDLILLRNRLAEMSAELDTSGGWPQRQLRACAQHGVYRWFLPRQWGGVEWPESELARGYQMLSSGCLTTTFVITQYIGACRRIAMSDNELLKTVLLPQLLSGEIFATVGISHLTTSRRHLAKPVLMAKEVDSGYMLDGMAPWVTGGTEADIVVLAAELEDGRQILASVPMREAKTVTAVEPQPLVAVNSSKTGPVHFKNHFVPSEQLLAGPVAEVMKQGGQGVRTGGVQTSALAVGLAIAAIDFLHEESVQRPELGEPTEALSSELVALKEDIDKITSGEPVCSNEELRTRANSLALRSSQAALTAAKGAGFVAGHPAGRWCREALFFLVWSCPQPVLAANLCELAGIAD